jgi:hypothetical protein
MEAGGDELVILVHGTGASQRGPKGAERWWEPEGPFAQEMLAEVKKQIPDNADRRFQLEAFVWSGANSERERRIAGQTLAERLKDLEGKGTPFHLVGHSHGGSVIWHAMRHMLRDGRPQSLRSWTTIGTPFLTFGDRGSFYLLLFAFLSLFTVGLSYYLLGSLPGIYLSELGRLGRDARIPALVAVVVGIVVTFALIAYSLAGLALQLSKRWRVRSQQISAQDASFLRERWHPLAHPEDEPINGLRASVVHPAEPFMPRMKAGVGARVAGKFETAHDAGAADAKPARPPITLGTITTAVVSLVAAPFYNRIIAPLLDQFMWETAKQVVQGNDVPGEYLIRCDRAPAELSGPRRGGSPDYFAKLSTLADSSATETARNFRARLAEIGEGIASVSALRRALSWDEVIHTTYFEPGFGGAVIIAQTIAASDGEAKATQPVASAASDKPASDQPRLFRPRYLYVAATGAAAALSAGAALSTIAVERAWLWPNTNAFQIDRMYSSLSAASPTSLRLMEGLDRILIRWVLLDRTDKAIETAVKLEDMIRYMGVNARLQRLQDIAFAVGTKGSEADLALLLGKDFCVKGKPDCLEGRNKNEVTAYLLAHAAAGGRAAGNGFHRIPERQLEEIISKADDATSWSAYLVRVMLHANAFEMAERFATGDSFCDGVKEWSSEAPDNVATSSIPEKLRECLDTPIKQNIAEKNYDFRNYFSLSSTVLRQVVGALPSPELNSCKVEVLGAFHAMNRCTQDRRTLTPILDSKEPPRGLAYDRSKPAHETLTEISNYGSRFSDGDPPSCLFPLQDRLLYLQSCIRTASEPAAPATEDEAPVSSAEEPFSWPDIWQSGVESQSPICGDGTALGSRYGRKMQAMSSRLGELKPQDRVELQRLVTLRTEYELRQPQFTDPKTPDDMNMADARCNWASLALVWSWLGDGKQSARLLDILLAKEPAYGSQMLDFYLGIADALKKRAPAWAKRFLDRSFALVDDNDPTLFFRTSDGSIGDDFAFGKSDIARLYAEIGEYRRAAGTNSLVDQFNNGAVSADLSILEAEIQKAARYDEKILNAAFKSSRPPGFRPR